jgi:hypothetical protein
MKYAVEMSLGAMICTPSFIKNPSEHSKVDSGGFTDIQTAWQFHKPALIFFKIRKLG